MRQPKRVYLAGPWVFRRDASTYGRSARVQATRLRLEAVLPIGNSIGDTTPPTAHALAAQCMQRIRSARAIIADVSPFRGQEPDSGTIFEIGYAAALGHEVILFSADQRSVAQRMADAGLLAACGSEDTARYRLEPFGLSVNAMLAQYPLLSSLQEALEWCAQSAPCQQARAKR